ncbi:MAG: hypothetical protein JJE22_19580, partial [Bacteroidia bacterium]|nr:hypothetical protein [Bacteroidia bacterium]
MRFVLKIKLIGFALCFQAAICFAQQTNAFADTDTLPGKTLDSVFVNAQLRISDASFIPDINGMNIYAGKRTNTVMLSDKTPGLELNLGRTALARIPGLTMWEM